MTIWRRLIDWLMDAREPFAVDERMPDPAATLPVPTDLHIPGEATHADLMARYPDPKGRPVVFPK